MLELKKWMADIEASPYGSQNGMTIEFYASDRSSAEERLDWLLQGVSRGRVVGDDARNWFNLEEVEEE